MLHARSADVRLIDIRTRIPFRYGITTLQACPHCFVTIGLELDGKIACGTSADMLPPKWFTKNPETPFRDDLRDMLEVIRSAVDYALMAGPAEDLYAIVSRVHDAQRVYATSKGFPPLLYNFGVSLVERALIDAFCRGRGVTFARALRDNLFGVRFSGFADQHLMLDYEELGDTRPADWLPKEPVRRVFARHTVGMLDYLSDDQVPEAERVNDGLPQSLEAAARYYGLSRFKIKMAGDVDRDAERLAKVFEAAERYGPADWRYTLDANENFKAVEPFRQLWERLTKRPDVRPQLSRLDFVEQPLHRDIALSDAARKEVLGWPGRPPIIIDESDGYPGAAIRALDCGYSGTSHKNCKGVLKGVANACLMAKRRRDFPGRTFLMSGEDLCNIGPVALNQDLAACAAMGIDNIERNGHHYCRGLSMFPPAVQEAALAAHPDLYRRHEDGAFVTLNLRGGRLDVGSVVEAPFGVDFDPDTSAFVRALDYPV